MKPSTIAYVPKVTRTECDVLAKLVADQATEELTVSIPDDDEDGLGSVKLTKSEAPPSILNRVYTPYGHRGAR